MHIWFWCLGSSDAEVAVKGMVGHEEVIAAGMRENPQPGVGIVVGLAIVLVSVAGLFRRQIVLGESLVFPIVGLVVGSLLLLVSFVGLA